MDSAVRHLRDGVLPDAASCATCCIFDNLSVIGGSLVLQHAVRSFIAAMRQGRSQATVVRLVDLTGALAPLAAEAAASAPRAAGSTAAPDVEYIDLHSDPWGWHRAAVAAAREGQRPEQAAAGPGPGSDAAAAAAASAAGNARAKAGADPVISLDELCSQLIREPASQSKEPGPGAGGAAAAAAAEVEAAEATAAPPAAAAGRAGGVCVVLGCLSTLMERYNGSSDGSSSGSSGYGGADGGAGGGGEWAGLALLEALRRAPAVSCVLAAVHTDLHSEAAAEGLRRAASCVLQLAPLSDLQQRLAAAALAGSGRAAQLRGGVLAGRLDCRTRRRTGRVKVESELYSISLQPQPLSPAPVATASTAAAAAAATAVPAVHFFAMPPQVDTPDPRALLRLQPPPASSSSSAAAAATAAATAGAGGAMVAPAAGAGAAAASGGGGGGGQPLGLLGGVGSAEELARAVGSSMRLALTEEERRAKQAVVLPYQHTGSGLRGPAAAAYAAGDHAGYLPPAAGGRGPGAGAGTAGGGGGEAAGGGGAGGGGGGGGGGRQGGLGHILYVRDSASEQDSDQDLDEDLDI